MAEIFSVSISDKELLNWMKDRDSEGSLPSLSHTLRDTLIEIKNQWEIGESMNANEWRNRMMCWKKIAEDRMDFIRIKGLEEECFNYLKDRDNKISYSDLSK